MTILEVVLFGALLMCGFSVIGMMYIYKSVETSLSILATCLHHMILKEGIVKYSSDPSNE